MKLRQSKRNIFIYFKKKEDPIRSQGIVQE